MIIMGIQAYIFRKRCKKHSHLQDISNETTLRNQQLNDMNKRLYDKYQELTQRESSFEIKKKHNNNIQEVLHSKINEVENRLQYLEGIRNKVGSDFKNKTTSIQEFKDLCSVFVSAHNDIEKVQMEVHKSEIDLEIYLRSWNQELIEYNNINTNLRKEIEALLKEIGRLNVGEMPHA